MKRFLLSSIIFTTTLIFVGPVAAQSVDGLPSWKDWEAKQSMVDFVTQVTKEGSSSFLPPDGRIATFSDAEREWAYDRKSSSGHFDKGLDEPRAKGWTVVDIKQNWEIIHPSRKRAGHGVD